MRRILFLCQRFCCAVALWFPRVGVNFLTTWGIYVLLFKLSFDYYTGFWRYFYATLGLWTYTNATIAYVRTVQRGGGSPLLIPGFGATSLDLESGAIALPPQVFNNVTAKDNGEMRFCSKCNCWKPDRTHHCRTCNRCVLRMDHHCPWFSSCIGHYNHRFFIQFLTYASLLCIVSFAASTSALVAYFRDEDYLTHHPTFSWIALSIVSGVMGIAVSVFTGFSLYLVMNNQTTVEMMETVRYKSSIPSQEYRYGEAPTMHSVGNVFDIGLKRNWCQIMGNRPYEWVLPVVPENFTDGTSFPINDKVWRQVQTHADRELNAADQQRLYIQKQREIQRRQVQRDMDFADMDFDAPQDAESIPLTERTY